MEAITLKVCETLIAEHRQTEMLLDKLQSGLYQIYYQQCRDALEEVKSTLHQLTLEMNTHFTCEEEGLFPILSNYHPMVLMEVEHDEILALRLRLASELTNYTFPKEGAEILYQLGLQFIEELKNHIGREEHGIFPTAERDLSISEKQEVIDKMAEIRNQATARPTPEIVRPAKTYRTFHLDLEEPLQKALQTHLLAETDSVQVKTLTIKAGGAVSTHWSPKQVILFCLQGEAQWSTPGSSIPMQLGDGLVMDPRLSHSVQAKTDSTFLMILIEEPKHK